MPPPQKVLSVFWFQLCQHIYVAVRVEVCCESKWEHINGIQQQGITAYSLDIDGITQVQPRWRDCCLHLDFQPQTLLSGVDRELSLAYIDWSDGSSLVYWGYVPAIVVLSLLFCYFFGGGVLIVIRILLCQTNRHWENKGQSKIRRGKIRDAYSIALIINGLIAS